MTRVFASGCQEGGQGCRGRVPVCRVVVAVVGSGGLDRPAPQALPEPGPLLVGHHHEVELDLLDTGDRAGGAVDLLGQGIGARPGRHGQGNVDVDAAPAQAHRTHQAEGAQRQADLRLPDRAQCSFEL